MFFKILFFIFLIIIATILIFKVKKLGNSKKKNIQKNSDEANKR
jgi:F0F1-type ATP synthase membrane subunit b/b'